MAPPTNPYLRSLATTLGTTLVAGLVCAVYDVSKGAGEGVSTLSLAMVCLGLYGTLSVLLGLGSGLIAGAFTATFGEGAVSSWIRATRDDRSLDKDVTGAVLATAVGLLILAGIVAVAAMVLVASVERKGVGAALLGVVVAGSVPLVALASLPVYRAMRRAAPLVPPLGPIPGFIVLTLAMLFVLLAAVFIFVRARLDVEALGLSWLTVVLIYAAVAALWVSIGRRACSSVLSRLPTSAAALVGLALLPVSVLATGIDIDEPTAAALGGDTKGARILATIARKLSDADGDGFSARLGGPDCDDGNPEVYPGAKEIPGNGIDDNCLGGDRPLETKSTSKEPDPGQADIPTALAKDANLLLIVVDTLRADKLGAAGYRRDDRSLTPRLDAFVASGAYFTQAYAQAPNTPRSFPSLFASAFPSQVAVDKEFKNYSKVLDENTLLFEALRDAGLQTLGFSSHFYFKDERGITQGFTAYDNEGAKNIAGSNKDIAAPRIVPKAQAKLESLAKDGQRFAMFVHLFEPHSTYLKHDAYPITERGTAGLEQKYDYEIAFTDQWFGKLLDTLDSTGLSKKTVVVIVSDHGEAFGVHRVAGKRMFFHGQTLYDELLRVPLAVRVPGTAATKIDQPVMLVDLAPTLLGILGAEAPDEMQGRDLSPAIAGTELQGAYAYAELLPAPSWNHAAKMAVSPDGKYKLIYRISDRQWELYDLEADPEERKNLYGKGIAAEKELAAELTRWMEVDLAE